jgi:TctA family transporter
MSLVGALIMLAGIYYGAQYGGSTTAILVNLPGETSAVVTCNDGYQMARQGRAGPALAIAAIGSFIAGTFGTMLIAVAGPPLAELALKFGAPEYFSLMLMGLVAAAVLAQGDMMKSLAMVAMGLLLGIVGTDVNTGVQRFSFGITELSDGIGFIVVAVGVFAIGEIIANLGNPEERTIFTGKVKGLMPTWADFKQSARRSCAAPGSVVSSACCPAPGRRSRRSRPTWSKRRWPPTRRASARAPSRASPGRNPPTTPTRNASSFRC